MKKSLLIVTTLIFIAGSAAIAQRKAGSKIIGAYIGSTTYNSGKYETEYPTPSSNTTNSSKTFSISVNPNVGWFVSDDIVVGANMSFGFSNSKGNSVSTTMSNSRNNSVNFGVGPWARFYFGDVKSSVWPYLQVSGSIGSGITQNKSGYRYDTGNPLTSYTYTSKSSSSGVLNWNAGASLGVTKMLNTHVGLDLAVNFTHYSGKSENNTDYNQKFDIGPNTSGNSSYKYTSSTNPIGFNAGVVIFL